LIHAPCLVLVQGTETMKRFHAAVGTEAQKYVATIFEVYAEVQRLRDNLREQHRIWIDFYASVFKVCTYFQLCPVLKHVAGLAAACMPCLSFHFCTTVKHKLRVHADELMCMCHARSHYPKSKTSMCCNAMMEIAVASCMS